MSKRPQRRSSQPNVPSSEEQKSSGIPIPIWVAIIGGIFTLGGIALTAYLNFVSQSPTSTPTVIAQATQVVTPKPGACPDDMVPIPKGTFWMGAAQGDTEAQPDEKPGKSIYLDDFCIDRMEVNNEQYAMFVKATNHRQPPAAVPPEPDSWIGKSPPQEYTAYPVVRVSWFDAAEYCQWKDRALPTEAQWEKAARGTDGRIYPWGNFWDAGRANSAEAAGAAARPVDSYPDGHSPYEILNMAGNVAEWVADRYQQDWYKTMPESNPPGPLQGLSRVIRGGSFVDLSNLLRVSARLGIFPPDHPNLAASKNIGFRCARLPYR
jgi:formylglycine-generating enzyme